MVRIVQENNQKPQAEKPNQKPQELGYQHYLLLNVVGLVVAEAPENVRQLLEDYSIELSRDYPVEDLADTLILAIGECNEEFNRDLASLILDRTLKSSYDQFDFKQLAGQTANILSNANAAQKNTDGQNAPGVLGSLASTLGQIGSIIAQNADSDQLLATKQTRQAIVNYRKQVNQQQRAEEEKKSNLTLILLLMALGIGILGYMAFLKRQAQQNIKTS